MRYGAATAALAAGVLMPAIGQAEDARTILETVRQKEMERREGVRSYMIEQTVAGQRVRVYFTRDEASDEPVFRVVSPHEIARRGGGDDSPTATAAAPETFEALAGATEMTGNALGDEIEKGLADAGLPPGLLGATGSDPWATLDPRAMMGGMAAAYRGMAAGAREAERERASTSPSGADAWTELAGSARLVGTDTIDGREAFHLLADGLDHTQEADGTTFTIERVEVWIDRERYVPLRQAMTGVAASDGERRPMSIETWLSDYRVVDGTAMLEPHRRVVRIAGVMDAEQQAEMREAQQKLAEMEEQMKQMPAAQRDMILRTMGPQMETMKKLAAGEGFEMVTETHDVRVLERM